MGIFNSLAIGVAGIRSQSNAIGVISDNLANISTIGYKRTTASFQDLFARQESVGFGYSGVGVRGGHRNNIQLQGEIIQSNHTTDLAISGSGFFIVSPHTQANGDIQYTRAGAFAPNADGDFVNGAGFFLQGWRLDENGDLSTTLSDPNLSYSTGVGFLETVNLRNLSIDPVPTSQVSFQANLKASQDIYAGTLAYDPLDSDANMSSGSIAANFEIPFTVVDDENVAHDFIVGFLKTGINSWAVEIHAKNPSEVVTSNTTDSDEGLVASGTLTFNGDGTLASVSSGLTDTVAVTWSSAATANSIDFGWGNAGDIFGTPGATTIGDTTGMGQLDGSFKLTHLEQNGALTGIMESIQVSDDGYVTGIYDNSTVRRLYRIPLVTFLDPNQLRDIPGTAFIRSDTTSDPQIRLPGQNGNATIMSEAVELANVEVSSQLTDIIIAQRAYQSNTKTITVSDEMLRTLDDMLA